MRHSAGPLGQQWCDESGFARPGISDYFYQYGPLHGDGKCNDVGSVFDKATGACTSGGGQVGYFGNKVLAVSYGGTLGLYGYKGDDVPGRSG